MDERDTPDTEVDAFAEEIEDESGPEATFDLDDDEAAARPRRLDADYLLDKVIPGEVDWRDLVRRHPWASIGLAAALGFLIGRSKGTAIVAGASAALSAAVMRQLGDVFETESFEF
jgi:hypothetical protein